MLLPVGSDSCRETLGPFRPLNAQEVAIWETEPRGVEVLGSLLSRDGHLPEGRIWTPERQKSEMATSRPNASVKLLVLESLPEEGENLLP